MPHRFECLFQQSPDGVFVIGANGEVERANPAACALLGRSEIALRGSNVRALFDDSEELRRLLAAREHGRAASGRVSFRCGDGDADAMGVRSGLLFVDGDTESCVILRDVSEQESAAQAVVRTEAHYRTIFERLHEAVVLVTRALDGDGATTWTIVDANRSAHTLMGRDVLRGMTVRDLLGNGADERIAQYEQVLATGVPLEYETTVRGDRTTRVRIHRQDVDLLGVTVLDVTAQHRAERTAEEHLEAALKAASELRAILDALPVGIIRTTDANDGAIQINRFAARMLGLPDTQSRVEAPDVVELRRRLRPIRQRSDIPPSESLLTHVSREGGVIDDDQIELAAADGTVLHIRGNVHPILDARGERIGAVAAYTDVTALVKSERALGKVVAQFNAFMDASPAIKWIKDADGRLVYANAVWEKASGYTLEQALGRTVQEMLPKVDLREVRAEEIRVMESNAPSAKLMSFDGLPSGITQWWNVVRFPIVAEDGSRQLGGIGIEVTAQKLAEDALRDSEARALRGQRDLEAALEEMRRTEEKLRQSQKMEAIGQLAGGVAHDFNNLLTVILANSEFLAHALRDDPCVEDVEQIRSAGLRAATLTRQLLAFSRKQALEPRVLSINAILRGMETMTARLLGEDIELVLLLHPEPYLCLIDAGQIEQVVLNLVVNARDAMPQGGRITVETANVSLDAEYVEKHPESQFGPHVMLSVSDTGTGMSRETQARLFEPFFTTKAPGTGTGLGLSTVYGIVKQSGGNIWVYSEPGHGTTFKVYFPRASGNEQPLPSKPVLLADFRGTETVLLAEDDPQVRHASAAMLRRAGYHVIEASNGGEALLICEQHGGTISLLVTDVVMPRMNGKQLAERLRAIRPDLKVLFISGYTANVVVHHGVVDAGVNFLQKPLTSETLLPKVRQVLDQTAP
jgi:PAS domain S-box-containing protein